jgi:predicted dehydrogenase
MAEAPSYVIVGRGRWAGVMHEILTREGRRVAVIAEARQRAGESELEYMARVAADLKFSGAQVAWLCVPPGPHIPFLLQAALDVGVHAVVEKPWLCEREASEALAERARSRGLVVGIHYEFCLLDGVAAWRREFWKAEGLEFGARFLTSKVARRDTGALDDLGSHLFSIREYAAPRARVVEIECAYGMPDERRAWLVRAGGAISTVNFTVNAEPIVQRFIERFEDAATTGRGFPFGLEFAMRVADASREWSSKSR